MSDFGVESVVLGLLSIEFREALNEYLISGSKYLPLLEVVVFL